MFFLDTSISSNDELFLMAKDIIATRSSFIAYSPTSDVFTLRETILCYTNEAEIIAMICSTLSIAAGETEIPGAKYIVKLLIKYPITYRLIRSMLADIDVVVLGKSNDYSCNISKSTIKEILEILADNFKDKIKGLADDFSKQVGSIYDNMMNGRLFSSKKNETNYVYGKIMFSLLGLSLASYTMVIGWMYMLFLKRKIINNGGIDLYLDDNIATGFINEFKNNKAEVNRINKYACEQVRMPVSDNKYFDGKVFDEERFIQDLVASVNENYKLHFDLERNEHSKLIGESFISASFEKPIITEEIATLTTLLLFSEKAMSDMIISSFINVDGCRSFKGSWETMIRRYLKRIIGDITDSIDNIKSRYCNYLNGQLNIPEYIWTDYSDYSNNLLYPNVQGANAFVSTLLTIYNIEQRNPKETGPSVLFLIWSFMSADIYNSYSKDGRVDVNMFFPYVLCALLRLFTPINRHMYECLYNTDVIHMIYQECVKTMPEVDDILDYLPDYFGVFKSNDRNDCMWAACVNEVMTRYLADNMKRLATGDIDVATAIRSLDGIRPSEPFIQYLMPLYRKVF